MFAAKAASELQSRVLGDISQWTAAAATWSRLQGELSGRRMTDHMPGREEGRQGETEQRDEESSRGTCGVEAQRMKRKRDEEEKESSSAEERWTSEKKRGSVGVQETSGRDHDVERSWREMDDMTEDKVEHGIQMNSFFFSFNPTLFKFPTHCFLLLTFAVM